MVSKIQCPSLLLIILFLFANPVQSQEFDIIQQQLVLANFDNDITYYYDGEIHLKNSEIYQGRISLNQYNNDQYAAILRADDGCLFIPNIEIETVILYHHDSNTSTRFVPLKNKEKLYRELYVKDSKNAIFDTMEKPFDGKIMNDVYVLEDNSLVSTYNFWHSGAKADLINYFQDRDQKKYKRRDFKNLETLFAQL